MNLLRFVGLLLPLLALSACGSQDEAKVDTPPTLAAGKLTACTDMPYEPFEFRNGDEAKGIDVDLVRAIAERMDLQADFHDVDFDSIFATLDSGQCDLIASAVSITPERQEKYAFSTGYFEVNQSLMVRSSDRTTRGSLENLSGRKIAVQKGTTGASYVASHAPGSTSVQYDDASEALNALKSGEVDGLVQDFPINSYAAQQAPDLSVVQTFSDVDREQYGFAMTKSSSQLLQAVNSSLSKLRGDGEYDEILVRYLGAAA